MARGDRGGHPVRGVVVRRGPGVTVAFTCETQVAAGIAVWGIASQISSRLHLSDRRRLIEHPVQYTATWPRGADTCLASASLRYDSFVATRVPPVIRRPHLAAIDAAFREAVQRDIEHCRALLDYLRDH